MTTIKNKFDNFIQSVFWGLSINIISLAGLIIGVGMMVVSITIVSILFI